MWYGMVWCGVEWLVFVSQLAKTKIKTLMSRQMKKFCRPEPVRQAVGLVQDPSKTQKAKNYRGGSLPQTMAPFSASSRVAVPRTYTRTHTHILSLTQTSASTSSLAKGSKWRSWSWIWSCGIWEISPPGKAPCFPTALRKLLAKVAECVRHGKLYKYMRYIYIYIPIDMYMFVSMNVCVCERGGGREVWQKLSEWVTGVPAYTPKQQILKRCKAFKNKLWKIY